MIEAEDAPIMWQISSKSNGSNCVEVGMLTGAVLVRDSKERPSSVLRFSSAEWKVFVARIRSGESSFGFVRGM